MASATKPRYQQSSAASMRPRRSVLAACASSRMRVYVSAMAGVQNSESGAGTRPSGIQTSREVVHSSRNSACTASTACDTRGTSGKPLRA